MDRRHFFRSASGLLLPLAAPPKVYSFLWDTGPSAYLAAYADASERLMATFLNVVDYGAVGDGFTDDTAAILSAIEEADLGGGVFFPRGTYRFRNTSLPGAP